jgi:HPt (histidine-containing phosphotransfer) domain-containing protein
MSTKAELQMLIERHCQTIAGEVAAVSDSLAVLWASGSAEAIRSSIEHAHKIVGSSGSIGFPEVSAAAAALEKALKALPQDDMTPGRRAPITALLEQLKVSAAAMAPEKSTLAKLEI